tara:strand:+ start:136 stop:432 length:297 start_codon:yes stop_codon:yes gene_type:complete
MLKSDIIKNLQEKYKKIPAENIELILKIFFDKITSSLKNNSNIEIRGFGTISKKNNKEKYVRNPKTNERIFKKKTYKIHFKIGRKLHERLNPVQENEE